MQIEEGQLSFHESTLDLVGFFCICFLAIKKVGRHLYFLHYFIAINFVKLWEAYNWPRLFLTSKLAVPFYLPIISVV